MVVYYNIRTKDLVVAELEIKALSQKSLLGISDFL